MSVFMPGRRAQRFHRTVVDRADETFWNCDSHEYFREIAQPYDGLASGGEAVVVNISAAEQSIKGCN